MGMHPAWVLAAVVALVFGHPGFAVAFLVIGFFISE